MISAAELRRKAENQYRPAVKALIRGENPFPLGIRYERLRLTGERRELVEAIGAIRSQSREVLGCGYSVEWRTVETVRYGKNEVPGDIGFATAEDLFGYLGKTAEAERILGNARRLIGEWPGAADWCARNAFGYLGNSAEFFEFVARTVRFFQENPFPERFARELPVEIPTKFIEENSGLLGSLIAAVAPESLRAEGETLEERLGLKTARSFVEVRLLDPEAAPELVFRHFTADPEELREERVAGFSAVVVVENRVPFLTLPEIPGALAIWGGGFALHRLGRLPWLGKKRLFYWGDLDVEGLEILAGLRGIFGHVEPVLMDRGTVERWRDFLVAGTGKKAVSAERRGQLTPEELELADWLAAGNRRLEQEKIPQKEAVGELRERMGAG